MPREAYLRDRETREGFLEFSTSVSKWLLLRSTKEEV